MRDKEVTESEDKSCSPGQKPLEKEVGAIDQAAILKYQKEQRSQPSFAGVSRTTLPRARTKGYLLKFARPNSFYPKVEGAHDTGLLRIEELGLAFQSLRC